MDFLLFTISWMTLNTLLALIPVFAGVGMAKAKHMLGKFFFGCIWLLFLPNTIYLLTDPFHLVDDYKKVGLITSLLTFPLYIVLICLGIVTFVLAIYPFEQILKQQKNKRLQQMSMAMLYVLIGFGLILGRIERVNSWEAITNISKTFHALLLIIISPQLLAILLLFTLSSALIYKTFKKSSTMLTIYKRLTK